MKKENIMENNWISLGRIVGTRVYGYPDYKKERRNFALYVRYICGEPFYSVFDDGLYRHLTKIDEHGNYSMLLPSDEFKVWEFSI